MLSFYHESTMRNKYLESAEQIDEYWALYTKLQDPDKAMLEFLASKKGQGEQDVQRKGAENPEPSKTIQADQGNGRA